MESKKLIGRHKLTSIFVRPTEKIFSEEFSTNSMYEEAMRVAVLLKEHRDSLERKVDHMSYLLETLKVVRGHSFNKQMM